MLINVQRTGKGKTGTEVDGQHEARLDSEGTFSIILVFCYGMRLRL